MAECRKKGQGRQGRQAPQDIKDRQDREGRIFKSGSDFADLQNPLETDAASKALWNKF